MEREKKVFESLFINFWRAELEYYLNAHFVHLYFVCFTFVKILKMIQTSEVIFFCDTIFIWPSLFPIVIHLSYGN